MRIFLSYDNRDRETASRVYEALLHRRPDLDIYFAPVKNTPGAYWISKLGEELEAADAVVLLLGQRVGAWQEIEYYEALKTNRTSKRPLIVPIALAETLPGLHFLDHFHRLILDRHSFDELVASVLAALDGAETQDEEPLWRRTNPYRGLPAMRTEDAAYFFGREAITGEILEALRRRSDRVIVLVGNSGVGKSSIALAGVLAALRSRLWPGDLDRAWPADLKTSPAWLPITITPGERPLRALAYGFASVWLEDPAEIEEQALKWVKLFGQGSDLSALADAARDQVARRTGAEPPPRTLLYIDQGEELYARAEPGEADTFSRLLAEAAPRPEIAVLTSIRSDYYGRLQDDAPLFTASDRIDVPPLDRDGIARVIEEPAARLGVRFDNPEIVPLIAEATAREPGALPMLSYLMSDTWEAMRRDGASDGALHFPFEIVDVSRPVADRAERFIELHPDSETTLRRLFTLKLAHVPKEGEPVRRRACKADCTPEEWTLVEQLAGRDWRLLTTGEAEGDATTEVAHEALLRNWPRLGRWLDGAREFLIWKGQLEADRRTFELADKADQPRALLTGLRLDTARVWRGERGEDLADADRTFIDASVTAADTAARRERETAARVARQRKWITRLTVAAAVAFAVFGGLATWQWRSAENAKSAAQSAANEAREARDDAETARNEAEFQRDQAELALDRATQETNRADSERQRAELELRRAQIEQARFRADKAKELVAVGDFGTAIALALSAMPQANPDGWPKLHHIFEVPIALMDALVKRRELFVLRGHEDTVRSAAFSPDGARIVTASSDETARLWDAATGAQVAVLRGHERNVTSAAFSPDGTRIVTASDDDTARLWDVASGAQITVLRGHEDGVTSAAFSPDGARVVTASWDNTARLWNATNGNHIALLRGHKYSVWSAAFSPEGARIVTTASDYTLRLWDAASGAQAAVFRGHKDDLNSAAFSPDGARIVTASNDGTARLWNAASGAQIAVLNGHEGAVRSVAFSPDGARIVTASSDETARLWDAASGAQIVVLRGHENTVWSAAFSPDGARVFTASADETARLWDAASGAQIAVFRGHEDGVGSAAFSPDGARLVTTSSDDTARLWDAASGAEIAVSRGHESSVNSAAFSPDGARLVTASWDKTARLWDAASGTQTAVLRGHEDSVTSAAFSPNGARVVTASRDKTARLWDAASGAEIDVLRGHEEYVFSAAFSPDGARVVTTSGDKTARLWDAASGAEIAVLQGHYKVVWSASFSPDGARLVTASDDGAARLWDAASGGHITTLWAHRRGVISVAFSPDGARLVTSGWDNTARLWDAASGAQIAVLRGHGSSVWSAAFSPDGARVVTASRDKTARLWDAVNGAEIAVLRGHENAVNSAAFSPDGSRIVTASEDNTARIWPHYRTMDELFAHARDIVERLQPLTEVERCAYYLKTEGCGPEQ